MMAVLEMVYDTKRLIITLGLVFTLVLVFQSSFLPYGSVLLSLFSDKTMVINELSPLHDSNSTNSSLLLGMVNHAEVVDIGNEKGERKGKDQDPGYESHLEEDSKGGKEPSVEKVLGFNKNVELENPKLLHDEENVASSESEDPSLTLEKADNEDHAGFAPQPLNFTFSSEVNINSSTNAMAINPQVSHVAKEATATVPKLETPVIMQSGSGSSSNTTANIETILKKHTRAAPVSIPKMNTLLLQSRLSSRAMRPRWSSVHDQELLSARSQIETAPTVTNDPELYAPLYKNLSMFKRSYQLMEHMLKVYTYTEGEMPIFHQPLVKGIYASEGWFMKLMEENRQFVVKDPKKAHMFYFPFGFYMLRLTQHSQSKEKLAKYWKDYVDMIAAKYPFWNRTGGADHFVVACHDWGPQETSPYMGHCIRALCNANVAISFTIGKDVSLPVTYIRNADEPLQSLGGNRPSKRPFLAFFAGSMHGYLRPLLLQYWESKDPNMKISGPLPRDGKMTYKQYMKSSKYCICARGYEVHTPRVVEAIFYECVPVIIADNYVPPFFEVLNWKAFSVFIPEKDIPNLRNILLSIPEKKYLSMQMRVKKVQKHFLWHKKPLKYDMFHMTLHSIWYNRVFQIKAR